jgi:alpha-L-fucosidase
MKQMEVIRRGVDAVSQNDTFILNISGKPDGTIDRDEEEAILDALGSWTKISGEAIYDPRPWEAFGDGPHTAKSGVLAGDSTKSLDSSDVRFTRNKGGDVVYAIVLGWPDGEKFVRKSLGTASSLNSRKVANIELLGFADKLKWAQWAEFLMFEKPSTKPRDFAYALKVALA